ncbi:VanZ family protein [Brevundimonas sp. FT23042]|uniref:VanZ family protein n=1 Tax=Brevundimonas sp. FT23042 TaxID=3393749 RepID=UPI003B588195
MSLPLRILATLIIVGLLVSLLGPSTSLEQDIQGLDKVAHFFAFGLALWAFGVLFPRRSRVQLAIAAVAFGALTEVVQGIVGRDADILDLLADSLGIGTALLVWAWWRRFRPRKARAPVAAD